jgi:hypothetical protein
MSHTRFKYSYLRRIVKEHTSTAAQGRLDPYSPVRTYLVLRPSRHTLAACDTGRAPRIRTGILMIPNHAG